MNVLLQTQQCLLNALCADPQHALAWLTVWLDPLALGVSEPGELDPQAQDYDEGEDPLQQALLIARTCFPEVYAEAIWRQHQGVSKESLETLLCQGFMDAGIPMEQLEFVWYGIPLPGYGADLQAPEFDDQFPQAQAVLELFGVTAESDAQAGHFAMILEHSLRHTHQPECQQVASALAWLWGFSGNSLIDLNEEDIGQYEPLAWEPENVRFARELLAEAEMILKSAWAGLEYLATHPATMTVLAQHLESIRQQLPQHFAKGDRISHEYIQHFADQLQLDWSLFTGGTD